jgi:hypothetical protein
MVYALKNFEAHWREMVVNDAIAAAAGYRAPNYFLNTYYTDPLTRRGVADGIWECHGRLAHWWDVRGRVVTHPHSAQAVKTMVRAEQRARAVPPVIWTTPTPGSNVASG